jgi:RNA polymerase sigma-70 factor (ECF subfamily)
VRRRVEIPDARPCDLAPLEAARHVLSYQPYWAAKAHLLSRSGDTALATEALTFAIGLSTDEPVKRSLQGRLASLQAN